jgi:hypothetical protein
MGLKRCLCVAGGYFCHPERAPAESAGSVTLEQLSPSPACGRGLDSEANWFLFARNQGSKGVSMSPVPVASHKLATILGSCVFQRNTLRGQFLRSMNPLAGRVQLEGGEGSAFAGWFYDLRRQAGPGLFSLNRRVHIVCVYLRPTHRPGRAMEALPGLAWVEANLLPTVWVLKSLALKGRGLDSEEERLFPDRNQG